MKESQIFQIMFSIAMGIIGVFIFLFLFPAGAISTAMHDVLQLPGPGAGIGLIFGPFIILIALLSYNFINKRGVIIITCSVFGVIHSILTPIVYPSMKTVGSLGPLHLRILAVVILGCALELNVHFLKERRDLFKYTFSAVFANIICLIFYWLAIFPGNKGWIELENIPILLAVTISGAIAFGGLITFGLKHLLGKN